MGGSFVRRLFGEKLWLNRDLPWDLYQPISCMAGEPKSMLNRSLAMDSSSRLAMVVKADRRSN